jgi:thermitase
MSPHRHTAQLLRTLAALGAALVFGLPATHASAPDFVRLLVKPRAEAPGVEVQAALQAAGVQHERTIAGIDVKVVRVPGHRAAAAVAALSRHPRFQFAEIDGIGHGGLVPDDPQFGSQWHHSRIRSSEAWALARGQPSVIVAVLDTGIQHDHPDLAGRILPGRDFVNNDFDPADDHGHGTAVAGMFGAILNNAEGIAGVAGGVSILPVKVLNASNSGSYSNFASGIVWAADQGARVINLSLSGTSASSTLENAVNYAWNKGAIVVAAAGNSGNDSPRYPAACLNALAITATTPSDTLASFSSFGSHIAFSAPGAAVLTTTRTGYGHFNGTSFATPVVSGVAALVLSANPNLTNAQVVDILRLTAVDLGAAGRDPLYGHGRVDAAAAVSRARAMATADTLAPQATVTLSEPGNPISGIVTVLGDAVDNVAVTRTEILLGSTVVAAQNADWVDYTWDTRSYADGRYTVSVRARDAAGNVGTASRTVDVANSVAAAPVDTLAPTVAITSPASGAKLANNTRVSISSSDNVGVVRTEFYVNGNLHGSSSSANPTFTWNTARIARGTYHLSARAYDAAGNVGLSPIVTVSK